MADTATTRRPGRPRDEGIGGRVVDAALKVLASSTSSEEITIGAIVAVSGVSRAAIYRRWASREALLADALDSIRSAYPLDPAQTTFDALVGVFAPDASGFGSEEFERLFRRRLVLSLEDPVLRKKYWSDHVTRRRIAVVEVLEQAKRSGEIREDVDVESAVDLLAGVGYYQFVVRADDDPEEVARRLRAAVEIVWRGIAVR